MMEIVEVWMKGHGGKPGIQIWRGGMTGTIPRVGEHLQVFPGFASEKVLDVFHDLSGDCDHLIIEIGPDSTGEYAAELKRMEEA